VFHATRRASVAEALNNIRQVKFAMDGFASDHNGRYPHEHLHDQLGTSGSSSNALFVNCSSLERPGAKQSSG
jgi:hypothetical protein